MDTIIALAALATTLAVAPALAISLAEKLASRRESAVGSTMRPVSHPAYTV